MLISYGIINPRGDNMQEILRMYKELRVINCGNITDRLLDASNGDMFVAYNTLRDTYEIHSVDSFKQNRMSINTTIEEEQLNQEIIEIIKSSDIRRFGTEIRSDREYIEKLFDNREDEAMERVHDRGRKMIETYLGREI